MIGSFKDGENGSLCRFYLYNKRSREFPTSIEGQLRRKLSMLEAASTERSLFQPRSNNYERLASNLEGWSSIRVNIQWRLIFRWRDGAAYDVYLDPHKY
ncbi:type II toxin-antitoxin system RelE/ParE family toxin [Photorhabdus temperata]|uniref:Plasmid maintenance system killer protein n=1 Tax=Photorhabdus temperata subsp. temperata Meg1 TaxID=1393735 RepID=A0A081S079_PHOTE|nr:type II toxin-antitoxin system RelE/ParE family toxin [Photorhabdus temperata]KER04332.1 plasmid maintenance system killer protein [Photorhabdus temperata subsp. temperata Meg1]MCT8346314.1 type II toxin-antitoxin system RelE/ParE family toxin [Photorhabdus temperata]